jgi:hypothetical protein
MAKKTPPKKRHHAEEAQPALIPMSEDELRSAGRELAVKVAELEELEADHAEIRKAQRKERDGLKKKIAAIASTIRQQGR